MPNTQRNGFILLLVVAMIPLVGMVLAIIITNSHCLILQTRTEELRLNAENAYQCGMVWLEHERNKQLFLEKGDPVLLTIQDSLKHVTCRIEAVDGEQIRIVGRAEDRRFSIECKQEVPALIKQP